jgi:hypothetical protein
MIIAGRSITRIVASGCSFTYGQGVDPQESWPAQLSELLSVECVNLGLPGMGNEHVLSSIVDYFSVNTEHQADSFVIPCFTSYSRLEFWSQAKAAAKYQNCRWTTIINSKQHVDFNRMFFEQMFDEKYYYLKYLRIIISLQSILSLKNIPYLMFEGISGNPHKDMINDKDAKALLKLIDRKSWLRFTLANLDTMTDQQERLPDGHPNARAYSQMSEILMEHIINNYTTE